MRTPRAWAALAAAAGLLALAIPSGGAQAAASGWTIEPSPVPAGATDSVLSAVSCATSTVCMAVGNAGTRTSASTLAELSNGSRWVILPTPNAAGTENVLDGVSCSRAASCVAVGFTVRAGGVVLPLALGFDAGRWAVQPTPSPGPGAEASLASVSCTATDACTAVGSYSPAGPDAVSQPLALHWNGSGWTIEPTPNPQAENGSGLAGVSCAAADACVAAGDLFYADVAESIFALHWDGSRWAMEQQPNPRGQDENSENSVSCAGADACTSVGSWVNLADDQLTLADSWNGTTWTQASTPNPTGATVASLNGVSCAAGSAMCTAVGGWSGSGSAGGTLAEGSNGSTWSLESTPDPPGAEFSSLTGVDCAPGGPCVAVGDLFDGTITRPLVEVDSP